MAEKWEEQLKQFWTRVGSELRRTGEDLRDEATKLVENVRDPAVQEKVKTGMREFGETTRKLFEDAAQRFEQSIDRAGAKAQEWTTGRAGHQSDVPTPTHRKAKKPAAAKKKAPAPKARAKKPAKKK